MSFLSRISFAPFLTFKLRWRPPPKRPEIVALDAQIQAERARHKATRPIEREKQRVTHSALERSISR